MKTTQSAAATSTGRGRDVEELDQARLVGSDRVLAVLKELAGYPDGASLDELTRALRSPKPTIHRALVSLRRAGLADQDDRGRYVLGDELLRMAFSHHQARPEHVRLQPALERIAQRFGETAHYAVLVGGEVVYRAKVDPPAGAVRLTSTVGGRNPAHATAVGKLLLAYQLGTLQQVREWVAAGLLVKRTQHTLVTAKALHAQFLHIREQGYAVDDQENEVGINCVAVPVYLASPTMPSGAVSVSAVAYRSPLAGLVAAVPELKSELGPLGSIQP